jgi:hypothetical protein
MMLHALVDMAYDGTGSIKRDGGYQHISSLESRADSEVVGISVD